MFLAVIHDHLRSEPPIFHLVYCEKKTKKKTKTKQKPRTTSTCFGDRKWRISSRGEIYHTDVTWLLINVRCSRSVSPDPDIYRNGWSGFAPRCTQQLFCRSHILPRVLQHAPILSLKRAFVVHRTSRSSDVNLCKWSRRECTFFPPRVVRVSHLTSLEVVPASAGQLIGRMATRRNIVGLYLFFFFGLGAFLW